MTHPHSASVRIPCSTSNLGAGFDTLGLALSRYLYASFAPSSEDALDVVRAGTLSSLDVEPGDDILVRAFKARMAELGASPSGTLHVNSEIPVARGLGSSAAAFVAGYELATAAAGVPTDPEALFQVAYAAEHHGDNAAPCIYGGLNAVVQTMDGVRAVPLSLAPDIGFAYAAPAAGVATAEARAALPRTVDHATAVRALGRILALVQGLATADPELIRVGVHDELHVPHRLPLIPGAYNAIGAGYDAGAWGVTVSGSGSGLIAICPGEKAEDVAEAMRSMFAGEHGAADVGGGGNSDVGGGGTSEVGGGGTSEVGGGGSSEVGGGRQSGVVGFALEPDITGAVRLEPSECGDDEDEDD
ncbi:MAG: homoserine kinase [Gemmatimonadota bacterium]